MSNRDDIASGKYQRAIPPSPEPAVTVPAEGRRLRAALRRAIGRGQLWLAYQPKLAAHTQRVVGVEALVRWQHPVLGLLSPASFVPLAESDGTVHQLTCWVLGEALDAQVRWRQVGLELQVAVNLSASSLDQPGLADLVLGELDARGLPGSCLVLELTETGVMRSVDQAIRQFTPMREAGVRISIDDFGTGFTSLGVLPTLPLDELKVDQTFVKRSGTSPADEAIVRTVRELAHRLGLDAVAEGIEDEATGERMVDFGYDVLQGFHYCPPLPEQQVVEAAVAINAERALGVQALSAHQEEKRLAALHRYGIVDSDRDAGLDDIVRVAAEVGGTPVALVSLVDDKHQWFAAKRGIEVSATPRADAFCSHALAQGSRILEVPDAAADPRFADNPLVEGFPHIRFYAGAPLRTADGHSLGTLCVIDFRPRSLTGSQRRALVALSRIAMFQLETYRIGLQIQALPDRVAALRSAVGRGDALAVDDLLLLMSRNLLVADGVAIWRREGPGSPWFRLTALRDERPVDGGPVVGTRVDTSNVERTGVSSTVRKGEAQFVHRAAFADDLDQSLAFRLDVESVLFQPVFGTGGEVRAVIVAWWHHPIEQIAAPTAEGMAVIAFSAGALL